MVPHSSRRTYSVLINFISEGFLMHTIISKEIIMEPISIALGGK